MKKYLMTGIAALALCVGFTSCSHDLDVPSPEKMKEMEAQKIKANYEKAFKAYIGGEIASTQTWGFGVAANARTRGEGDEHFYADANEWAAKDGEKYLVPDPLTDGQKARVQYYYQMNQKNTLNEDKGQIDFFVQQVYKGGTDPMPGKSAEQYIAADNENYIVGSDHMDQLTAGSNNVHINNYNYGEYSHGTTYPNVLDNDPVVIQNYPNATDGGYVKNDNTAHHHGDQISLMLNTKTDIFGYANSNSSIVRNLYWMRSAEQIDAYIAENKAAYDAWLATKKDANGNAIEDKIVNDFWGQLGRGFIGFDFEMMVGPELFQENRYVTISDIPGNAPQYIWDGTRVIKWWNSEIKEGWQTVGYDFVEGYDEYVKIDGQKIPYLTTTKNFYAGDQLANSTTLTNITQSNLKIYKDYSDEVKNVECLNLPLIRAAFEAEYYPTEDKAQTWVRVGDTADGYYSDWIVTFMPALHYTNEDKPDPATWSVRVMAEDLSATEASDFDFNDVVLDFFGTENSNVLNVTLQAAGGTLPLRINEDDALEVHNLFKVETNVMVNTNWTGSNKADKAPVPFTITLSSALTTEAGFLTAVKNVMLEVEKTGADGKQWIPMEAKQGEPASKFAIPLTDPTVKNWCNERTSIKGQYEKFAEWARTGSLDFKWW